MEIDDIDFTRSPSWLKLLSEDEWEFFEVSRRKGYPYARHTYVTKIQLYEERFQNHMPIPLRKCLLEEISSSADIE